MTTAEGGVEEEVTFNVVATERRREEFLVKKLELGKINF